MSEKYTLDEAAGILEETRVRNIYEAHQRADRTRLLSERSVWAATSHLPFAAIQALHVADCPVVQQQAQRCEEYLATTYHWADPVIRPRYPHMLTEAAARACGHLRRCGTCAPGLPQDEKPKREPPVKASGLGWPIDSRRCVRSKLTQFGRDSRSGRGMR